MTATRRAWRAHSSIPSVSAMLRKPKTPLIGMPSSSRPSIGGKNDRLPVAMMSLS